MGVNPIPDGYHSVQSYLIIDGAAQALEFYGKAFGATTVLCMKQPDGRVGHAEIQIGDSRVMMADENPQIQAFAPAHYGGSPVNMMIYTADCDAMYRAALAAGAQSLREPADQPYGDRMAGVEDPYGYKWWLATHIKDLSKGELENSL
jgi:PhnB protein